MIKRSLAVISVLLVLIFAAGCVAALPTGTYPSAGTTVYFGEWDTTAGMQPILWRVLGNDGGKLLLISDKIIDAQSFAIGGASFKDSAIHAWLNIFFYARAFSAAEQASIAGTEGDKVSLLSREDALNTSYFANDAARAATATLYAQVHGCMDNNWWLSTEPSPNNAKAEYVGGDGAINEPGLMKFDTSGVRPVISINLSAVQLVMGPDMAGVFAASAEGVMQTAVPPPASPYTLAVRDSSLPTLSISDYTLDDSGLTVNCTSSAPLAGGQEVYCLLVSKDGGDDYLGWSSLSGGHVRFSKFNAGEQYYALLGVGTVGAANYSSYAGTTARIDSIDALGIAGIDNGVTVDTGSGISFTAVGWGLSNTDPMGADERWVPVSWSVIGGPGGTWTDGPYTAAFSIASAGPQTLTVQFRQQSFVGGEWTAAEAPLFTRSVQFNVETALTLKMSPADGKIYTGGRVTITPSIAGGAWSFDTSYLKRNGNVFTGLKAGTVSVTYTLGNRSAHADVTISQASLPDTGQNYTFVYLILGAAALLASLSVIAAKAARKKKRT